MTYEGGVSTPIGGAQYEGRHYENGLNESTWKAGLWSESTKESYNTWSAPIGPVTIYGDYDAEKNWI